MTDIYFLLGSNLGNRENNLAFARKELEIRIGAIIEASSIYETAAWGQIEQPDFLNQVVRITTNALPLTVLEEALNIEETLGRTRDKRWESRILDVDILYFGDEILRLPDLTVPHPRIQERRFTLVPLAEIAPDFVHPKLQKTQAELLQLCDDLLTVKKFQ